MFLHREGTGGEHRHEAQRHEQGTGQGEDDHVGHFLEEDPRDAAHENDRKEDHQGGDGARDDGRADLPGSFHRGGRRRIARLGAPAENVFQDHDGAVDHHAHAQRQPPEGHQVQGEPAEIDQREGRDDGDRDRQGDHQRAAEVAQEEEQHQDRQSAPVEHRLCDILDRPFDEVPLVDHRDDPDLRKGLVDRVDLGQHPSGYLDGVRVGLLPDRHPDAASAVHAHDPGEFLVGVGDPGDLAERHRGAVALEDDRIADLIEIGELGRRAKRDLVSSLFDLSRGQVEIGVADRHEHPVEGKLQGVDPVRVKLDPDLAVVPSPDVDLGHSRDVGEPVSDLVLDQLGELHGVQAAGDSQKDHRETGDVELAHPGPDDVLGELVELVFQLGLDIQRGGIDVRSPHEGDADTAVPLGRLGHHVLHSGDGADDLFDDLGDQPLHHLRAGPLVLRADGDGRKLDVGEEVDPQAAQGHRSENHDDQGDHRDEDRPPYAEVREIHLPDLVLRRRGRIPPRGRES